MPQTVVRDLFAQPLDKLWTFRTRADEFHVATKHVPELRDFVQARAAQESADRSNARIVIARPGRPAICLCIGAHGPKLVTMEDSVPEPNSLLPVERWPWRRQFDQKHDNRDQRQGQN